MKIVRIESYLLECKLKEPFGWSMEWRNSRRALITKITTDEGIVGWGEGGDAPSALIIRDIFAPLLSGENTLNINKLWHKMYHSLHNAGYTGGFAGDAISAVDIALWDISGKASGKSISEMLGGALRDKVSVYATGLYYKKGDSLAKLLKEAEGYAKSGFMGMKTKIGGLSLKDDFKRVKALRETIGDDLYLMVDANQAYSAATAIEMGRKLSEFNIHWFEEPVFANDIDAHLQVKSGQPIPVAGGETLRNRFEARDLFSNRALDIIQPDVERAGGITEIKNIAVTANTYGMRVNLHSWGSSINVSASLSLSSTLPLTPYSFANRPFEQETVMEFDQTENPIRNELCNIVFEQKDGYVDVPDGPGLGIEIDSKILEKYCIDKFTFTSE